ncbi:MAG: hypothetical protein ABIS50_23435 [Luteolibacter sp.]|uniref:hypothetical protein n=1 Tax=Luteolibacter sp. TaxID=1962973 RepID=UPI003267AB4A
MAKHQKPDDYFRRGPIEMARFGKAILMRSNWDEEDHRNYLNKVIEHGPISENIVDSAVSEAIRLVRRNAPIESLRAAYHLMCMENSSAGEEPEETEESVQAVHGLEFIHNVIASTKPEQFTDTGDMNEDLPEIFRLVGTINRTVTREFLAAEMLRNRNDSEKDSVLEEFRYQAINHWVHVRGERYTVHEKENLEDLLLGQDEAIRLTLGLSSVELLSGVNKIIGALTIGFGDAVLEMKEIDELCSPEFLNAVANSKNEISSVEEAVNLMHEIVSKRGLAERVTSAQQILQGFGLFDLGKITGWSHQCLSRLSWKVGEVDDFLDDQQFSGWPTRTTPISQRPFLEIDSRYYCFSVFGLCDHFYRVIEKIVRSRGEETKLLWDRCEKEITETVPLKYFETLLPGSETIHDIYYRWMPKAGHAKREWCELDGLVLCGNHLIILEVKAVAFARKSPFDNFGAHVGSFESLISKPSIQGLRFLEYLQSNKEVSIYDKAHKLVRSLRKSDYSHITVCALSIDAFTEITSKLQHLVPLGIEFGAHPVLPLSLDDLRVYRDVFTNPYRFLHFLEQRMKSSRTLAVELDDELDHIGLYLEHNDYSLHAEDLKSGLRQVHGLPEEDRSIFP